MSISPEALVHLSWSGLSTYMQCPLKYKYHHLDNLYPAFTASSLLFGSCIHEAIGGFLQTQQNGDTLTPSQMHDVFLNAWRSHDGAQLRFAPREDEAVLMEKAHKLLSLYHDNFDPQTVVLHVEESFGVDLQSQDEEPLFELPLFTGIIDSVVSLGDTTTLVDYKTSAKKPNGNVSDLQLVAYSLAAPKLGWDPRELDYRFEYLVKTKEPELINVPVTITDAQRERFIRLVGRVWHGIKQAVFYPNPTYLCGNCCYQYICQNW